MFLHFLIFLGAGAVVDWLWTVLVVAIDEHRPVRAALAQIVFTLVAIGATVSAVESRSLSDLLAYALGGGLGTYLVVKHGRKRQVADPDSGDPR